MAFKPITIEKTIKGKKYIAQFNGVSTMFRANDESEGKAEKMADFLFKNVLVEPQITDKDEFFGTDVALMDEVIEFAGDVMRADPKYFRDKDKGTDEDSGRK